MANDVYPPDELVEYLWGELCAEYTDSEEVRRKVYSDGYSHDQLLSALAVCRKRNHRRTKMQIVIAEVLGAASIVTIWAYVLWLS